MSTRLPRAMLARKCWSAHGSVLPWHGGRVSRRNGRFEMRDCRIQRLSAASALVRHTCSPWVCPNGLDPLLCNLNRAVVTLPLELTAYVHVRDVHPHAAQNTWPSNAPEAYASIRNTSVCMYLSRTLFGCVDELEDACAMRGMWPPRSPASRENAH